MRKFITRNRLACSAYGSAWRYWAGPCASKAGAARARPSQLASPRRPLRGPDSIHMRILITEDHAVVREGLKLILADHFKKAVFGEARNATEALARVWKEKWDVVVLDITMPGRSGLEVLKEIKRSRPRLPVLILSMHPEDQFAVRL